MTSWAEAVGDVVCGVVLLAGVATVVMLARSLFRDIRKERVPAPARAAERPRWPEPPAEKTALHCERCGIAPDDEQRAAIATDPALVRVHAEPSRFALHWYCPRCATLGKTTSSGVSGWDWHR